MGFPHYKEWMGEVNKVGDVHVKGVKAFVKYAKSNLNREEISCPCVRCRNGKCLRWTEVELHLLKWGMQQDYVFWIFHGEKETPYIPEQLQREGTSHVEDHLTHHTLNDLIDDAYRFHAMQVEHTPEVDVLREEENSRDQREDVEANVNTGVCFDNDLIRLRAAATRPLYPNCNSSHTSLYAMVGLHNIKSRFGLSGNSVTEILLWAKDLLPKENTLPDNYPNMKSSLKGVGMKYKSIHACKYDCILYRKEHKDKIICPVCKEPRFVQKIDLKNGNKIDTKVPHKALKYFPLAPRLRRLFTVPWIAEAMTWHARAEVGENLMRHPIDSSIWKSTNLRYPNFAQESRNVRLGIATDGFNPFGNLSTNQSIWPVILVPYNLPPSLCMRKEFSILALLIPGPKAPGDDIDVFLAPLVDELNELWDKGVKVFDSFKQEEFTLKSMLLWAIHDFPAYGTLSGCIVHGYLGCPICGEEVESSWLDNSSKIFYHTHRRFLPASHKLRSMQTNFLPEGVEFRLAPKKLSGWEIEEKAAKVDQSLRGKHPKTLSLKRKKKNDEKKNAWSRRSILFDLPYWKEHSVRHVIDLMHAEKNIIEHLVDTCLDGAHSKDGVKAREDLRKMKIRRSLWLKDDPKNGKKIMPVAAFTLSTDERKVFLDTLYELKVPSNFSSNLRRIVSYATHDLKQCKSHDWHVIMQLVPLLFGHCFSKHKDLRRAILQISLCFTLLCEKVVNRQHIMAAKATLAEATCVLEKYFIPSFFDISIHLLVHLCDEALICGPARYRWMYPFERLMKTFKDYVKNPRYIAGSIAEEYIIDEASVYTKEYMPNPSIGGRECFVDESNAFADDEALGKGKKVTLTSTQYEQVTRYVFETHIDIDNWRANFNASRPSKKRKGVTSVDIEFRNWVARELLKIGDVTSRLARLANGPNFVVKSYDKYRFNGFLFSTSSYELKLVGKQNSGISYKALTYFRSSAKDRNLIEAEMTYYGIVRDIWVLDYTSFNETVFYCDWVRVEDKTACMVDPETHLVKVDLTKLKSKNLISDEPFVCAFQKLKQVFYSKIPNNDPWSVVLYSPKRLTTSIDDIEAPIEYQSILDDNPELKKFLDS